MVGAHRNLNGARDLTTPVPGTACRPWASTFYDQPIYQIWSLSTPVYPPRKYDRRYKMSKMGWFGVVRGHSRSLEIAPFDKEHTSFY